jgi:hypothetical protein
MKSAGQSPSVAMRTGPRRIRRVLHARPLTLACLALGCALLPGVVPAIQAQGRDDRSVKAAFVYNLTKYVEWPQLSSEIVIGVVSEDPAREILKTLLDGKMSESRTIRILLSPSDQDLERCDLVYIAGSTRDNTRAALERVRKKGVLKGVLTVGDSEFFVQEGGMLGLVTVEDHVQIQVNLQLIRESGLKISSRLLSIAVVSQPRPGRH